MEYRIRESGEVVSDQAFRELHPNVSFPAALDAATLDEYGTDQVHVTDPPAALPTQSVRRNGVEFVQGSWQWAWLVTDLPAEEGAARLVEAQAWAWVRIKAERDRRKSGGVKVAIDSVDYWFHSDDATRTQLGILDAKAIRAGWPDATVIHPEWKTMSGAKVPMTVARLREILDKGIANEAAIFDVAEQHRAAMEASTDPAAYDFSAGWAAAYAG